MPFVSVRARMNVSRRLFLTGATGLAAWPWLTADAAAQLSAHPSNEKDLPPVPPDEPIEGPAFLKCGPMIGHVAHDRARIWLKASNECELEVSIATTTKFQDAKNVAITPGKESAFAVTVEFENLEPAKRYFYRVTLNGVIITPRPHPSFVTPPMPLAAGKQRIAFVSCAGYRGYMSAASWGEMAAQRNFDLVLMLGDNHYANTAEPAKQRADYVMHRSVAGFRDLTAQVPCLGIWDDHDYGPNDSDGTLEGKEKSLATFKEFWANAAFGEPENSGCYHKFTRGDVDFFMLDVRYHRSPDKAPKDDPAKTMLGEKQLAWLKRELKASQAKVKFIASGSEMQTAGTLDSWASYPAERRALLDYLRDEIGDGVVFLSGDRHFSAGYQVEGRWIEVTSGPLGSGNAQAKPNDETWLHCSIGKMWSIFEVDTTGDTPKLAYELWLAGAGLAERRELTWDEVNGRAKIAPSPALPRGVERAKPQPK
jgi:alkaline phosphatase D